MIRPFPFTLVIAGLIAALFLAELALGVVDIPIDAIAASLTGGSIAQEGWGHIVREYRLPRALAALVGGASLGACGLMLQTLFRNPLADPFVLGIAHGARFGVALLVVATGLAGPAFAESYGLVGDVGLAVAASAGTILVMGLLTLLARRVDNVTLLLSGLMLGYIAAGLISLSLHLIDETQASAFKGWDDASFAGVTWAQHVILLPACGLGLLLLMALAKPLNILMLGDTYAQSLGVPLKALRYACFGVVALLVGTVTAFCGAINFLGLIAGHAARGVLQTEDHRILLPAAALAGGALALATDLITHLPWARHLLHLNAVNGLIGGPIVLWVLLRRHALFGATA
ncbi:iron ABC transporter permease [Sphingopyxis sp. JAI128]|uniref:FecCD family ABC transporter permease n=1 Tax=Sphingopyxis sp. JAI128 TaxID=2723066 RepID=UPI001619A0A6|nr:iron ABC transporter permease [Sphingopyxis sp. JAI128]MBB6426722.1 iron complex transport system permease protein [Sphingopyxis sp. JAI128]